MVILTRVPLKGGRIGHWISHNVVDIVLSSELAIFKDKDGHEQCMVYKKAKHTQGLCSKCLIRAGGHASYDGDKKLIEQ